VLISTREPYRASASCSVCAWWVRNMAGQGCRFELVSVLQLGTPVCGQCWLRLCSGKIRRKRAPSQV